MTVEDILSKFDERTALLASQLREFLLKELKDIIEFPDNSANIIGYAYGSGYKDLICVILLSKQGVKLGLNGGAQLPDPRKLLSGKGKVHRYATIKTEQDIKNPALKKLLTGALKLYQKRNNI